MASTDNTKHYKIYCDYKKFKGNTFENNINSINNLLLGRSNKISNKQFIYYDEKDEKNYLSANYFMVNTRTKKNEVKICYPHNFLHSIYYYNNLFFYVNKNNELIIFKFIDNKIMKYVFGRKVKNEKDNNNNESKKKEKLNNNVLEYELKSQKINKENNEEKKEEKPEKNKDSKKKDKEKDEFNKETKKEAKNKVIEISIENANEFLGKKKKLDNEETNLNERYEILCDILINDFKEKNGLNIEESKDLNRIIKFEFDNIISCEIKNAKLELDCTGIIKEKLEVQDEEISFEEGIRTLKTYMNKKKKIVKLNQQFF